MEDKVLFFFSVFTLLIASLAFSKSQASVKLSIACPEKFSGKVVAVKSIDNEALPKLEVIFQKDNMEYKQLKVVKSDDVYFKLGETYQIEMRGPYLCRFRKN